MPLLTTYRNDSKVLSVKKAKASTDQNGHGAGSAPWNLSFMPSPSSGGSRRGTWWQEALGFSGSLRLRLIHTK